ncbi:28423_t:CDS:2, partial [Racocetra persica]
KSNSNKEHKVNKNRKKDGSNKPNEVVSTSSNKPSQTSKKEEENLLLSSNQLARRIKCTSKIPNNECYQNGKNSDKDGQKVLEWSWKAREGQGHDDKKVTLMINLIKRNYFMNGVKGIPIA